MFTKQKPYTEIPSQMRRSVFISKSVCLTSSHQKNKQTPKQNHKKNKIKMYKKVTRNEKNVGMTNDINNYLTNITILSFLEKYGSSGTMKHD